MPGPVKWNGGGATKNVFEYPIVGGDERTEHPTQKPLALMMDLVRLVTEPGDTVLDPFAGSGTTLAAAAKLGRRYIGIEREASYIPIIEERLEKWTTADVVADYF